MVYCHSSVGPLLYFGDLDDINDINALPSNALLVHLPIMMTLPSS